MSIYLKEAIRRISNRSPITPITKHQLYNMLIDYGAFRSSLPLKYAVKNLIYEGFWSEIAKLYNTRGDKEAIDRLKYRAELTFGINSQMLDLIFCSIQDSEDWNEEWNPGDLGLCLHFEDLPIYGRTFDFIQKLIDKGYSWEFSRNCLIGTFYGINDCEVICNSSWHEVPVYTVTLKFPSKTSEEDVKKITAHEIEKEEHRLSLHTPNEYKNSDYKLSRIHTSKIKSQYAIEYVDGIGMGFMIESCLYEPHNNLETID